MQGFTSVSLDRNFALNFAMKNCPEEMTPAILEFKWTN